MTSWIASLSDKAVKEMNDVEWAKLADHAKIMMAHLRDDVNQRIWDSLSDDEKAQLKELPNSSNFSFNKLVQNVDEYEQIFLDERSENAEF
jgi:hypothetical protein